jgi:MinD-like ATPase involved in chromosome partitioning or flagellar assembly
LIEGHTGSESLSEMLNLPGVHPSLSEFLNHKDKQLTHGDPGGVRLLAFQVRADEFRAIKAEDRDILFEILKREEEASDYVVTTFETDPLDPGMLELLRVHREAVVIGQADDPVPTYQQIKALCHYHPGLHIGLMLHGVSSESEAAPIVERLGAAARRFLDKSISLYGILPPDPLLDRSLAARVPVFNLGAGSEIARRLSAAAGEMVQAMGQRAGSDEPARLMFERIQTGMV